MKTNLLLIINPLMHRVHKSYDAMKKSYSEAIDMALRSMNPGNSQNQELIIGVQYLESLEGLDFLQETASRKLLFDKYGEADYSGISGNVVLQAIGETYLGHTLDALLKADKQCGSTNMGTTAEEILQNNLYGFADARVIENAVREDHGQSHKKLVPSRDFFEEPSIDLHELMDVSLPKAGYDIIDDVLVDYSSMHNPLEKFALYKQVLSEVNQKLNQQ